MDFKFLTLEQKDGVATITLNRPDAFNALSLGLGRDLFHAALEVDENPAVRCVVVTGAGRAFCAGGDVKDFLDNVDRIGVLVKELTTYLHGTVSRFCRSEKPIIMAVNGVAAGGGLELAMSCDFIVASSNARFGQPEASRGIMPGCGGTQLLSRLVPYGLATELLLTGRLIDATEAERAGLVTHVFAADELLPSAIALAESIAANSPMGVGQIRRALRAGRGKPLDEALQVELDCYRETVTHPDRREGVSAFNEGRAPRFADPD